MPTSRRAFGHDVSQLVSSSAVVSVRRCRKLVIRNGNVKDSGVEYNGIVTARCHAGYRCASDSIWGT